MLGHKLDMGEKDGFDSREGRGSSLRGFVDSCEQAFRHPFHDRLQDSVCLLYTSDAADERSSVDLGGRRIIKKKTNTKHE